MILLPYAHERQTVQRLPYITFGLIALNVIIFLFTHYSKTSLEAFYQKQQELMEYVYQHPYLDLNEDGRKYFEDWQLEDLDTLREAMKTPDDDPSAIVDEQNHLNRLIAEVKKLEHTNPLQKYGYTPANGSFITLITCMFLHGGWLHLLGNMFFLYLAGCSIEDLWGRPLYVGFYLLSGIIATLIHVAKFPDSTEALVGASGAIAGLMGAFMVRLWDTKISFFYMFGIWYRGTFKAPAFIMLPLWLLQQVFYAMMDEGGEQGVAFWAHIGGFVFGAAFAFAMKQMKVEEKHIAPKIEKKVSLEQNPDFLAAIDLSEQGKFPEATILLHRVVKTDPGHVDAWMELKRISEINGDADTYNRCMGGLFENLVRTKEHDLLLQLFEGYVHSPLKKVLPPKALFAVGGFFEEIQDYGAAAQNYETLAFHYPQDPLALKALSKTYRLNFERLRDPAKGAEAFWLAFDHPAANDQWRSAMQADRVKYQIPERKKEPVVVLSPSSKKTEMVAGVLPLDLGAGNDARAPAVEPPVAKDARAPASAVGVSVPSATRAPVVASNRMELPHEAFDGSANGNWRVVHSRLEKLGLKGLELSNPDQNAGFLGWKKIRTVSVGRIRMINPATSKPDQDYLVVDLICGNHQAGSSICYRLFSHEMSFQKIFPRVDQTFEEAYQNFLGILLTNSEAKCIPNRDSCIGPNFAVYPELSRYDLRVKEKAGV